MNSDDTVEVNAYLGIGSNIEPRSHLTQCAAALKNEFVTVKWSTVYLTDAVGMHGPRFMNAAVRILCPYSIDALLSFTKNLERQLGRTAESAGYHNRTLDIDILLYGDACMSSSALCVPDAALHTEAHTLLPLTELAPKLVHPTLKRTLADLLKTLQKTSPEKFTSIEPADLLL